MQFRLDAVSELNRLIEEKYDALNVKNSTDLTAPFFPTMPLGVKVVDASGEMNTAWVDYFNKTIVSTNTVLVDALDILGD